MLLYRRDFCYSMWSTDHRTLIKGCLFEANATVQRICNPMDVHRDSCVTCQYDGCNKDLRPSHTTRCLSTGIRGGVDCRSYKKSSRLGCFAAVRGGKLELGCNTERTEEEFRECANVANDTCQLCMTNMCNKMQQGRLQTCAFGDNSLALTPKVCRSATDRCVLYEGELESFYRVGNIHLIDSECAW